MGVYSPIFCCEGNIRGRTLWVGIHPYFDESNSVFLAVCSQTWHHECVTLKLHKLFLKRFGDFMEEEMGGGLMEEESGEDP